MSSLYIVSTPIGNLNDISKRAIEVLSSVEIICVEDTRVSKKLLNRYKISNKMVVYNNFNESRQCDKILDYLNQGKDVALISDAGTPCISDPGYLLVNRCRKNNISVFSVLGPSSLIAALSISGLPTDAFYFECFLPKKKGRKTKFESLILLQHTIIIFESPMRIIKTLEDIKKYFGGERIISIHRELTKMFEESYLGNINEAIDHFSSKKCKGEFVLIIAKEGYKI